MPGLVPGIHEFGGRCCKTWMANDFAGSGRWMSALHEEIAEDAGRGLRMGALGITPESARESADLLGHRGDVGLQSFDLVAHAGAIRP